MSTLLDPSPAAPGTKPLGGSPAQARAQASLRSLFGRVLRHLFAVALATACVAGFVAIAQATGWKLPRASALLGSSPAETEDWCKEHGVPLSGCVECRPDLFPRGVGYSRNGRQKDWCEEHGVHDCPLCRPDVAQLPERRAATPAELVVAANALAFSPRVGNEPECNLHLRRVQLGSDELAARLGLAFVPAWRGPVREVVTAPAEVAYDQTRVARVTSRASGTVFRVEKQLGDKVRKGDLLAVIDSAEVGRAKAEFQQALVQLDLRRETLAKLRPMAGATVAEKDVQAVEAAAEEAEVRLVAAEELLSTLGLSIQAADVRALSAAQLAERLQSLGLPDSLKRDLAGRPESSTFLPVYAPHDGEVVARSAVPGEVTDPTRPLFVIADTGRMRLTLRIRPEDANRVRPGQAVRFRHTGHHGPTAWDAARVTWVSPAADERSRTVPVLAEFLNPSDRHHSNTFGAAEVVLREEASTVLVPASAVHWEGCCHVVFVRDVNYERPGAPKVFHVRSVRPGARSDSPAGPLVEIAAGLLPGEVVASAGSGALRSELLKNNLGEGCACCAGK